MLDIIPNSIYKHAAELTDKFPDVPFLTLAQILHAYTEKPEETKLEHVTLDPRNNDKVAPRRTSPIKSRVTHSLLSSAKADTLAFRSRLRTARRLPIHPGKTSSL